MAEPMPEPEKAAPPSPDRLHLHMPVDVRSAAIVLLAVLASVYMLHWASAVLIPLLMGVMFSYALSPAVGRLHRWRIPRPLGAAVLLLGLMGGAGWLLYSLSDDTAALVESLPEAAQKLRLSLRSQRPQNSGAIERVQKAAAELERAADENAGLPTATRGVTRVQIERSRFNIQDYLWTGTLGLVGLLGQATVVALITYFLLASGDSFRRKMVKIAGPKLSSKKITLQGLDEIHAQIQRYLLVQLFTSAVVGVATWLAFLGIGLQHAAVWGVAAGVTNLIPYIGALAVGSGSALVAFMQFGTLDMGVLVGGTSMLIHAFVGYLLAPWLTSRASRLSPVAVFVGVLAWGWLWGVWGLLLGVPMLMIAKTVCDRVDGLNAIGELLGS